MWHRDVHDDAAGAGVPAVAVPVLLDQPFWAAQLHQFCVAPPPLPQQTLTADTLADGTRTCLDDPGYRQRGR
jgi:UDP:flavonoid glycosyltransferase YjiC (YdhE family)